VSVVISTAGTTGRCRSRRAGSGPARRARDSAFATLTRRAGRPTNVPRFWGCNADRG
jgi:hypothetical protein